MMSEVCFSFVFLPWSHPSGYSTAEGARWHAFPVSTADPQAVACMLPAPMLPLSCRNRNHPSRSPRLCGSTCTTPPPASCGAPTPTGPPLCPGLRMTTRVSGGLCCVRVGFRLVMCRYEGVAAWLGWFVAGTCFHAAHNVSRCPPCHERQQFVPAASICRHGWRAAGPLHCHRRHCAPAGPLGSVSTAPWFGSIKRMCGCCGALM